eukprot:194913-Hanusia_phi.AAC.1
METLQQVSHDWVAGHHELFNPIRDQGSYSVEVVPGGLQIWCRFRYTFRQTCYASLAALHT